MGGPQAGLLVGGRAAIDSLRRHPLLRALRLDKMSFAALEARLGLYREPHHAVRRFPILRMLHQDGATPRGRAEGPFGWFDGVVEARIGASSGYAGSGALPGSEISKLRRQPVLAEGSGQSGNSIAAAAATVDWAHSF